MLCHSFNHHRCKKSANKCGVVQIIIIFRMLLLKNRNRNYQTSNQTSDANRLCLMYRQNGRLVIYYVMINIELYKLNIADNNYVDFIPLSVRFQNCTRLGVNYNYYVIFDVASLSECNDANCNIFFISFGKSFGRAIERIYGLLKPKMNSKIK